LFIEANSNIDTQPSESVTDQSFLLIPVCISKKSLLLQYFKDTGRFMCTNGELQGAVNIDESKIP